MSRTKPDPSGDPNDGPPSTRRRRADPSCPANRTAEAPVTPVEATPFHGDPDEREPVGAYHGAAAVEAEPTPQGPGHTLFERAALVEAIRLAGFDGGYASMSQGEEQRVRALQQIASGTLFRRHLIADSAMLARLEQLGMAMPNFAIMTQLVVRAAHLSRATGWPLALPPVLLLGEPGCGKSAYARRLALALDTSLEVITGSTLPDVKSLTGYGVAWRSATKGRVASALIAASTSAPIVVIDEASRVMDRDEGAFPLDRLLTWMEPHTGKEARDEFLLVPMRADRIVWLLASNDLNGLSEAMLDRLLVIEVPRLRADERDAIVRAMVAEVTGEAGVFIAAPAPEVLGPLRDISLRRTRLALQLAIARAVAQGRRHLVAADVTDAVGLLANPGERQRRPIGFLLPGRPAPVA